MSKELRLDRLLSNMGYGTRKDVKKFIRSGLVKINNQVVRKSSQHVSPEEDTVEINGEIVEYRELVYIMMNKPQGVISATQDDKYNTVVDILDDSYKIFDIFPMGRLDIDTEGLLILTNDGKLAHEILSPKNHIPKVYFARIDGRVDDKDVEEISKGIVIDDGYKTLPGKLKILISDDISEIELTIYEGKFHQVKRMFEALDKKVLYLKRISMGDLKLDPELELGEYRELDEEELEILRENKKS